MGPDAEGAGEGAGGGDVVGELHAEQVVHGGAEGEFDAEGHFGGEGGFAVEEVGERGSADLEDGGGLGDGETEGFDDFGADEVTGVGRVFHGHGLLLVVVDQVDVSGFVFRAGVAEDEPPVAGHAQAP